MITDTDKELPDIFVSSKDLAQLFELLRKTEADHPDSYYAMRTAKYWLASIGDSTSIVV